MSADDILASLAAEGALEAHGGFSIDKEKAREKMRQFQLSDPRQYVLMLVQAAVQQGATHVEFQIDADDMEVWFDGEGYSKTDLDDLFVSVFGDREQSNLRSRQELAIALNGALALNPRWVRIWSHRRGEACSLQLRPGAAPLESAEACAPKECGGTHVHVKQRFRPGLALRFIENLKGTIAEEAILKDRVRYAELPIILDGGRISSGLRLGAVAGRIEIQDPGVQACCGLLLAASPQPATLEVLNAGVWLGTHRIVGLPDGFVAMVDATDLKKDVSQTDVVRDEAYAAILRKLSAAFERSLLSIARTVLDDPTQWHELPAWIRAQMPIWIAERVSSPSRVEAVGNVLPLYFELPVWPRLGGEWMSTAQLRGRGFVDFVSRPLGERPGFEEAIAAQSDELRAALRVVFGKSVRDRTAAYEEAGVRAEQKAQLLSRDWSTTLGDGLYLARVPVTGDGIEGEVGFRRTDREASVVQIVYQGKLLETIVLKSAILHLPGFVAVVQADFAPTSDWTRSRRDEALAKGLHAVAEATLRALEQVGHTVQVSVEPKLTPVLRVFASVVCRPDFARSFYLAAGFGKQRASRWRNKFGKIGSGHPLQDAHPLLSLPLFPQLAGGAQSVVELRELYSDDNPAKALLPGKQRTAAFEGYVICDKAGRVLLRKLLGSEAVVPGEDAYTVELAADAWRRQPEEPFVLLSETAHASTFSTESMEVIAGLLVGSAEPESASGTVCVQVMKERRSVGLVELPSFLDGLVMLVDWLEAPVTSDFSRLREGPMPELQRAVDESPARLFEEMVSARHSRADDQELMTRLRELSFAPFLQPGWLGAFDACHTTEGAAEAGSRLRRVLRLAAQSEDPLSMETVHLVMGGIASDNPPPADRGLEGLAMAVASRWAELRETTVFRAFNRSCSLVDLLADLERHDKALLMSETSQPDFVGDVPRVVLVVSASERAGFIRVFGRDSQENGLVWFERWRAREAFELQEQVELVLPPHKVLVKVGLKGNFDGELAIPRTMPSSEGARIVACRRRRKVCDLLVPEAQISFIGVVESDSFGETREFKDLSERDTVSVAAACRAARPRLAEALRAAWSSFDEGDLRLARAWGRALLELMGAGRSPRALKGAGPRSLANFPLFPHLNGTLWGLDAIVDAHAAGEAIYVARDASELKTPDLPRLVFVEQPYVTTLLQSLLGEIGNLDELLRIRRIRGENRSASPAMPTRPDNAVHGTQVSGRGLTGELWIDVQLTETEVALGDREKLAGIAELSSVFIVGGAVHGPAVSIERDWGVATLEARGAQLLREKARELYEDVADRFDPLAADRSFDWHLERSVLRGLVERMRDLVEAGEELPGRPARALYRDLRTLPLFELPNGRSIPLKQLQNLNDPVGGVVVEQPVPALAVPKPPEPMPVLAVDPEPARLPMPEPEPIAPPTPEAILLDAIRTELRIVRRGSRGMFSNAMLDLLRAEDTVSQVLAEFVRGAVHVNLGHPIVMRAMSAPPKSRARYVSIVASSVFSAFNAGLAEVTDNDELEFHRLHAEHLAT